MKNWNKEFKKETGIDWEDFSLMSLPFMIIIFIQSIVSYIKGEQ